jgi:hypothetical protein
MYSAMRTFDRGGPRPAPDRAHRRGSSRLIVPGQGIGSLTLGMDVQEVAFFLDVPRTTSVRPDGSVEYSWAAPPDDAGLGLRASGDGLVYEVFVVHDGRYATEEGLGVGSSDSKVRRTLGEPQREIPSEGATSLRYDRLGVAFDIATGPQARFPGRVFRITVLWPR